MRKDIKKYLVDKGFVVADYCCYDSMNRTPLKTGDFILWRAQTPIVPLTIEISDGYGYVGCDPSKSQSHWELNQAIKDSLVFDLFKQVSNQIPKITMTPKFASGVGVVYDTPHLRCGLYKKRHRFLSFLPKGYDIQIEAQPDYDKVFSFNEDSFEQLIEGLDFSCYPNLVFGLNISNDNDKIAFWKKI